jgi:hypothetical protein
MFIFFYKMPQKAQHGKLCRTSVDDSQQIQRRRWVRRGEVRGCPNIFELNGCYLKSYMLSTVRPSP